MFPIAAAEPNAYFMPGADPGEGYAATNSQLFGSTTAPVPPVATNNGFVSDFSYTLGWEAKERLARFLPARPPMTSWASSLRPCCQSFPVSRSGFAVCDAWFASVPTETLPNRAFVNAGTSQGHMDDTDHKVHLPELSSVCFPVTT